MKLEPLPLGPDPTSIAEALPALEGVLGGHRAILPVPADESRTRVDALIGAMVDDDGRLEESPGTLIACTSGSTGRPKGARLRSTNLTASAAATASHLGSRFGTRPGPWLLALPPHHIAGLQVLLRSLHAGHSPATMTGGRFTTTAFAEATVLLRTTHTGGDLHTSLVPTQLQRLLGSARGRDALREYAAILVGGAATSDELVATCRREDIPVVLTYGSSETAGGMVYDGTPIPGGTAAVEEGSGRILLSGPTVADGYRNVPDAVLADAFPTPGTFRTSDLGRVTDGVLTVTGRADGAINSGGLKILPEEVEAALTTLGHHSCAVGVPDGEWGEIVVAVVETPDAAPADRTDEFRTAMAGTSVAAHLIPRRVLTTDELPLTGPGKVDRRSVRDQARTRLGR